MAGDNMLTGQFKKFAMRSAFKAWSFRLLAAVTALALLLAGSVGAYAHATGHQLPRAVQAGNHHALVHAGLADGARYDAPVVNAALAKAAACEPGHIGHSSDCGKAGHSLADSHDTVCHGGQAILAADGPAPPVLHIVPMIEPAVAFDGTEPGSLDRPPKAFLSA